MISPYAEWVWTVWPDNPSQHCQTYEDQRGLLQTRWCMEALTLARAQILALLFNRAFNFSVVWRWLAQEVLRKDSRRGWSRGRSWRDNQNNSTGGEPDFFACIGTLSAVYSHVELMSAVCFYKMNDRSVVSLHRVSLRLRKAGVILRSTWTSRLETNQQGGSGFCFGLTLFPWRQVCIYGSQCLFVRGRHL